MSSNGDSAVGDSDLDAYRTKVRAWVTANLERYDGDDPDLFGDPSPERIERCRATQAKIHDAGYAGFTFPREFGGQGLTLAHERVFLDEIVGYDVPTRLFGVSINILGATLAAYGTPEQKARYIRPILRGEELFLQLLSEPSGGSDLAGLLTSARREGDNYIVNGQKTWSSSAHFADFGLCPVRTAWDLPKHRGISLLIIDLRSEGIDTRRIDQINGEAHFCEEFFTDVVVPAENLVGAENGGWEVIRGLLEIEHAWVGRGGAKRIDMRQDVSDVLAIVRARGLGNDIGVRREVTDLQVELDVQRLTSARVSHGVETHQFDHGYGGLLKIGNDSLAQRGTELALTLAGASGVTWQSGEPEGAATAQAYLTSRSAPIAGGSAEIMRNNVSERVLGLPREPGFDRNVPFNEIPHN
jgi:alkylation response protein AidB-like acyl-CoA dehydrogenase